MSMEDIVNEIREKTRQRQEISQNLLQKYTALADKETDPFRKDIAETLASIQFTINSVWLEIERLNTYQAVDREKVKLLYNLLFTLPQIRDNEQELNSILLDNVSELTKRIKKVKEGMR